jgi:mRNA-degrading endonuclease RelE of RelBE toxin-antitoxin system
MHGNTSKIRADAFGRWTHDHQWPPSVGRSRHNDDGLIRRSVNAVWFGKQMRPVLSDRHSARRGTDRVIDRIDDAHQRVTVLGVFSRAAAYRAR